MASTTDASASRTVRGELGARAREGQLVEVGQRDDEPDVVRADEVWSSST